VSINFSIFNNFDLSALKNINFAAKENLLFLFIFLVIAVIVSLIVILTIIKIIEIIIKIIIWLISLFTIRLKINNKKSILLSQQQNNKKIDNTPK